MKKRFLGVVCFILALQLAACGPGGSSESVTQAASLSGGPQSGEEPITLNWYINFNWFTTTWDDNLVARTITRETGVSINFITPTGNEREKLNSLMATGTLPDLVTLGHWEPQAAQMVSGGMVYPLNELADEYDPAFWQVAHPERVAWYTQADGNLYGYPNSSYAPADYDTYDNIGANQAFLVREDIYKAIGSPDMTTPEGFMQAVRDAAALFPTAGGQPLIPIGLYDFDKDGCYSLESILMNLLAVPYEKDGQSYDRHTDEDYVAWLKVFRQLAQEGYLTDDVFVDRRAQMAEKVAEGRYFCMLYQYTDIADQQIYLAEQNPGGAYMAVDGPRNAQGAPHALPGVGINGWTLTFISKNCENPARAIRLMSYLMSEHGQMLTSLGVEGETYDMENGRPVTRPGVQALLNSDRAEYNRLYGADNTYWMLQDLAMQQAWQPAPTGPLAQPRQWTYPYTVYTAEYETIFADGTPAGEAHQAIREEWGRVLPALLLAESDEAFDELFAAYLQKREALGFALVQQEATRQMLAAKERLRIFD